MKTKTATQTYIESLKSGPLPNTDELMQLCSALHSMQAEQNCMEYLWMSTTFQDLEDSIYKATRCLNRSQEDYAFDSGLSH
jgi:hypothetical protein